MGSQGHPEEGAGDSPLSGPLGAPWPQEKTWPPAPSQASLCGPREWPRQLTPLPLPSHGPYFSFLGAWPRSPTGGVLWGRIGGGQAQAGLAGQSCDSWAWRIPPPLPVRLPHKAPIVQENHAIVSCLRPPSPGTSPPMPQTAPQA